MNTRGTTNRGGNDATAGSRRPAALLTPLELGAIGLAVFTLVFLYGVEAAESRGSRSVADDVVMFVPHILLIALIVAGLRRLAVVVMSIIFLAAALFGLVACLASMGGSNSTGGLGFAALLQVPLFALCVMSVRQPIDLDDAARLGPRLALGALVAALGWFGAGAVIARANAPYVARKAAEAAAQQRERSRREARAQVLAIVGCLQRVPVNADSQPLFPSTLSDLASQPCADAARGAPPGFALEYTPGVADSAGQHRGFLLRAHDEPMSDSARTFEADESMVVRSWYGQGPRRSMFSDGYSLAALGDIGSCVEQARDTTTPNGTTYPGSLAAMLRAHSCGAQPAPDSLTMLVQSAGGWYQVAYRPPSGPRPHDAPGGYTLSIEPARDLPGRVGGASLLRFFSDTAGMVHVTRRARPATANDPVIPDCPGGPSYHRSNEPVGPCRQWTPRQRWGLTSAMPTIGWSQSGSGTVGVGDTLYVIAQYLPIVDADSAVEARYQWDATIPDSTVRRKNGLLGEGMGRGVNFRLHHAYPDTGMKQIRFHVRSAAGDQYEFRDSVRVLLGRH